MKEKTLKVLKESIKYLYELDVRKDFLNNTKRNRYFMPTRLGKIKKSENNRCQQGCGSQWTHTDTAGGSVSWNNWNHFGKQFGIIL